MVQTQKLGGYTYTSRNRSVPQQNRSAAERKLAQRKVKWRKQAQFTMAAARRRRATVGRV
jgi:hypothetical protein